MLRDICQKTASGANATDGTEQHDAAAEGNASEGNADASGQNIETLYNSTFATLQALEIAAMEKLEAAKGTKIPANIARAAKGVKSVQSALNKFISLEHSVTEGGDIPTGRRPDDAYISVLYLILSVAGGIAPSIAKFGMNKIPYLEGGDWLEGFEPVVTRYGTSMKEFIIFRWVCSGQYAKTYEDNLRAKLTRYLVQKKPFRQLDQDFLDAIDPYLRPTTQVQSSFQYIMRGKGKADATAYAHHKDIVLENGPFGFYANRY